MYICAFSPPLFNLFRVPLKVLVRTPEGTRTQGWEYLSYHIAVCKEASKRTYVPHSCEPTLHVA